MPMFTGSFSTPIRPTGGTTTEASDVSMTPVADVEPVIGTTTGNVVTGTSAGLTSGLHQTVVPDTVRPDVPGDLVLPELDQHDGLVHLNNEDVDVGYDDTLPPQIKKFPTLLVVGGVAVAAVLWLVLRK